MFTFTSLPFLARAPQLLNPPGRCKAVRAGLPGLVLLLALCGQPVLAQSWRTSPAVTRVPVVTSYWPLAAAAGSVIKVNGRALHDARYIDFNGKRVRVTRVNGPGTQLTATVPTDATSGSLRVQTATTSVPIGRFRLEHGTGRATRPTPRAYSVATASNSMFTPSAWRSN